MDTQARRDMETMAEWAATQDAYERLLERRTRRWSSLRFWFNIHQVADEPVAAVATPEETHRDSPPTQSFGVASGEADSEPTRPPIAPTLGDRRFVGLAGPQTTPPPGVGRGPATPHHFNPSCRCASCISAADHWT